MNPLYKVATLTLLLASAVITNAQTLRVQILNGKSGKPLVNQRVVLMGKCDSEGTRQIGDFHTQSDGMFTVSPIDQKTRSLDVYVEWHHPCAKNRATFSLQEIISAGIVSENSCKAKLERIATPGTLILFVRDETFFEKMAH